MRCPNCTGENPDRARFCLQCGASFSARCAGCGAELPSKARFCLECGRPVDPPSPAPAPDPRSFTPKHLAEKILSSRSALEGERKQVAVLFADVKGSMGLSETIDPEDWHRIMDRFFAILTDGVHRFEGTVNQYTGDGIMALFGAPIAHEDHAARACYAALSLQDDLRRYANELRVAKGISFSVRMGLNSGEVVVGTIGDDLRMDYTALGHTASLGARMEQIAEPGKAYVSEHTARLVEGLVTLQDLGKLAIKGAKEPLRVYELQGIGRLKTHLEVSRARGFSKFVGRSSEMAVLQSALERALQGSGQVVGIVADPGVGKSRLCFEFVERCRARGIFVNEGHCLAHGKTIPYVPILELWRSYFGIAERDSNEEARRKIAGTLLLLDPGLHESLPLVFEFLGVTDPERPAPRMDPEARERRLFALLRDVIQFQTERQPLILLIDDLHWIDRASDGWIAQLADLGLGWRLGVTEEETADVFAEGRARAERSGDPGAVARLVGNYAIVRGLGGSAAAYVSGGIEMLRFAEQTDDAGLKLATKLLLAYAHFWAGDLRQMLRYCEEGIAASEDDPNLGRDVILMSPLVGLLYLRGIVLGFAGQVSRAPSALEHATQVARQAGELTYLSWGQAQTAILGELGADPGRGEKHAGRAFDAAERSGSAFDRASAAMGVGVAKTTTGSWAEAASALDEALAIVRSTRVGILYESFILARMTDVHLALGNSRRALEVADEAISTAQRHGTAELELRSHLARARALSRAVGADAKEEIGKSLMAAEALVKTTGAESWRPFIHEERARLADLTGDEAARVEELREAERLFLEIGAPIHAERIAKELRS
jgi:class 3 adenylate cyclase/tetratricopeptide (TPR) repeat protein